MDASTRGLVALALLLSTSGCWMSITDHCRGCTIVDEQTSVVPSISAQTRAVVVLVHGAFGFGDEWRPIVEHLRARPHLALTAFAWAGPWTRNPSLPAEALRRVVQAAVDDAPPGAEILVIAHSAGGALTDYVGERLRVAPGRHVRLVSIASPEGLNMAPYHPEPNVNTPLGLAIGGRQPAIGPMAPHVEYIEFATTDRPRLPRPLRPGVSRVYLGKHVGHNASLAVAALPLVDAL